MQEKYTKIQKLQRLMGLLTIASLLSCGPIEQLSRGVKKDTDGSAENTPSATPGAAPKDELSVKKEAIRKSAAEATTASQAQAAAISCSEQQERFASYAEGSRASANMTFSKCLDEAKDAAASDGCLASLQTGLDTQLVLARKIFGC
ncbi:MAG: hypothetical protein FJ146_09990 [Deltaproteobacteria bacterium]|nr:hypothetical protein [Deltaproteobacteria bacterium]